MIRLGRDAVVALFWLAMQPVYWVVRCAVKDELDCRMGQPTPPTPGSLRWPEEPNRLTLAEENVEVWEPMRT